MLLTDARRAARTRPDGSLVPLAEQDRSRWDRARIAEVRGPAAGLDLLAPLLADPALRRHHRLHAVHAHLLERAGRLDDARAAYATAARLATSIPEQRYLNSRI